MMLASRLKWLIVLVLGAAGGMGAMRVMSPSKDDAKRMARVARVETSVAVPPGFFDVAHAGHQGSIRPRPRSRSGQILLVEVLEALPGRPITGERDRPGRWDDRHGLLWRRPGRRAEPRPDQGQRCVEHLCKYLNDEVLGLMSKRMPDGNHY